VDDKRRRILDAALVAFAARGFHGTAVPEVAEAAGVGTGTLYRYFEHKEALVNEVFRDAKARLAAALGEGVEEGARPRSVDEARALFARLWSSLAAFARAEPDAFRFLEMQDHVPYLDDESRALELAVLAPLARAMEALRLLVPGPSPEATLALVWGAFVGLVKAERLGYLRLDDAGVEEAGTACWNLLAAKGPHR
jgi:AcrR family transcriptional regulator